MNNKSLFNGQKTLDELLRKASGLSGNGTDLQKTLSQLPDLSSQAGSDPFLEGMYEVFGREESPAAKSTGDDFLDGFYGFESANGRSSGAGITPMSASTTGDGQNTQDYEGDEDWQIPSTNPSAVRVERKKPPKNYQYNNKKLWADSSTLQGKGVLPDGTLVYGDNVSAVDQQLLKLKYQYEQPGANKSQIAMQAKKIRDANPGKYTVQADKPLSYYQIPDVTDQFTKLLKSWEQNVNDNYIYNWSNRREDLISKFQENGPYDIRKWSDFNSHELYQLNGEIIDQDALWNIAYGYLGKAYTFPDIAIYTSVINTRSPKDNLGDWLESLLNDSRNSDRVKDGIELYKKMHS